MEDTENIGLTLRAQAVKKQVSIYDALETVGVSLPSGHHTQQILCPFHFDRHPSARVYEDHFHCFTCGKSWDAIDVIQERYVLSYPAAIAWLEGNFELTPASVGLVDTLTAKLKAKPSKPPVKEFYEFVETSLITARATMEMGRYHKLSFALDYAVWQFAEKKTTMDQLREQLGKILVLVNKPPVGDRHAA